MATKRSALLVCLAALVIFLGSTFGVKPWDVVTTVARLVLRNVRMR